MDGWMDTCLPACLLAFAGCIGGGLVVVDGLWTLVWIACSIA